MESSELYQLNHGTLPKEGNAFVLSEETAKLIQKGLEYGKVSDGAFDIAIEPVSSLWDFTSGKRTSLLRKTSQRLCLWSITKMCSLTEIC